MPSDRVAPVGITTVRNDVTLLQGAREQSQHAVNPGASRNVKDDQAGWFEQGAQFIKACDVYQPSLLERLRGTVLRISDYSHSSL
jgi:hypothetical protein